MRTKGRSRRGTKRRRRRSRFSVGRVLVHPPTAARPWRAVTAAAAATSTAGSKMPLVMLDFIVSDTGLLPNFTSAG
jgi:hypothetical protein